MSTELPDASAGTRTWRVGLVGYGYAGRTFHAPLLRTTPGLALAAVASRQADQVRAELGEGVQLHADPVAMAQDAGLDLIVIASPNDTHHPLALAALQAGKAVVIDKPMALDSSQAEDLVGVAAKRGLLLSVFHNRRWDGDFLTVAALLRSGRLGRVVQAELHFDRFRPQVRDRWREAAGPGGGIWADLGPHLLDQAVQLFGLPQALQVALQTQRDGARVDDSFDCQLLYASGLRVRLGASMLAALPGPRFALHGTQGSLRSWGLDGQEDALKAGMLPDPVRPGAWGHHPGHAELAGVPAVDAADASDAIEPRREPWPLLPGCYPAYYAALRDALAGLAPNPVPAHEALAVMQLLDLGRASHMAGRPMAVPPPIRPEISPCETSTR